MALLDKFRQLADAREALAQLGEDPFRATIERILSPTEAIVNGRPMILAGTNNYLGLTLDTQCIEAAVRAVREEGTGTTGSRMANGSYSGHVALEKELADFYGRRWCVVFSTGYLANLGLISALTGPGIEKGRRARRCGPPPWCRALACCLCAAASRRNSP